MKLRTQPTRRGRRTLVTAAAASVSAAALVLSGCGVGGANDAASSGTDELTVVVEGGGKAELEPIVDLYKEETGTTVKLVELPYAGLYDRVSSELKAGQPDGPKDGAR